MLLLTMTNSELGPPHTLQNTVASTTNVLLECVAQAATIVQRPVDVVNDLEQRRIQGCLGMHTWLLKSERGTARHSRVWLSKRTGAGPGGAGGCSARRAGAVDEARGAVEEPQLGREDDTAVMAAAHNLTPRV